MMIHFNKQKTSKAKVITLDSNHDKVHMVALKTITLIGCLLVTYISIQKNSPFTEELLIAEGIFFYAIIMKLFKIS